MHPYVHWSYPKYWHRLNTIDGWVNKEDTVVTYDEILRNKKECNLVICDNMNEPWGYLYEVK